MEIIWVSSPGLLITLTERIPASYQLVATAITPVTFNMLAGKLPPGLAMDAAGLISGTPHEVSVVTDYKFVVRAVTADDIADRTFMITVSGDDLPIWVTPAGYLNIGVNGTEYVLDSTYISYQLVATDSDTAAGDVLSFRLLANGGDFPPGLTLSQTGLIYGFTDPILAVDFKGSLSGYDNAPWDTIPLDHIDQSSTGFDSYLYDVGTYDYSVVDNTPRKLNRSYTFTVEVSDGLNSESRMFKIYVVTESFLTDNNIIFQRVPIWITDPYIGILRANNQTTILLDVFDPPTLPGLLSYFLVPTNLDGSPSTLPPGLTFDNSTGDLHGFIHKQKPVMKSYQFTVMAVKFTNTIANESYDLIGDWDPHTTYHVHEAVRFTNAGLIQIYICGKNNTNVEPNINNTTYWYTSSTSATRSFTVDISGEIESNIIWVTEPDLGTITLNHASTLHLTAKSLVGSTVSLAITSGRLPPDLILLPNGNIIGAARESATFAMRATVFDNNRATFELGDTTFDNTSTSTFSFTATAYDTSNSSSVSRLFQLQVIADTGIRHADIYAKAFLSKTQRLSWQLFITDPGIFISSMLYRHGDTNFGVQTELKTLIYAGLEIGEPDSFMQSVGHNHALKRMIFGDVKYKTAYDQLTQEPIYEVIYVDMVDPLSGIPATQWVGTDIDSKLLSSIDYLTIDSDIPLVSDSDKRRVFPISTENMRARLELNPPKDFDAFTGINATSNTISFNTPHLFVSGDSIKYTANSMQIRTGLIENCIYSVVKHTEYTISVLLNGVTVKLTKFNGTHYFAKLKSVDLALAPLWMRGINSPEYTKATVLCYTTVGNATNIISRIKAKTKFASRGVWSTQAAYQVDDTVIYNNCYYTCVVKNTNIKPDNTVRSAEVSSWSRNFDFKLIDFTVDRYMIKSIDGVADDQYIAFPPHSEN